jgi:hypothetical protein
MINDLPLIIALEENSRKKGVVSTKFGSKNFFRKSLSYLFGMVAEDWWLYNDHLALIAPYICHNEYKIPLAVSITEPPPMAMMVSASASR